MPIDIAKTVQVLRNESDWGARRDAAEALGKARAADAVPDLISALEHDTNWVVRFMSALALGEIGDHRAVKPILAAIERQKSDPQNLVNKDYYEALARFGPVGYQALTECFKDPAAPLRQFICEKIAEHYPKEAVDFLIAALSDSNVWVRREACFGLGSLKDKRALAPLRQALGSPETQAAAAVGLARLGDPRAIPDLVESLKTATGKEANAIGSALEKLGWKPEKPNVGLLIAQKKYEEAVDQDASAAVPPLVDLLSDPDRGYRAGKALQKAGSAAVPCLLARLGSSPLETQFAVVRVLNGIDDSAAKAAADAFVEKHKAALRAYWRGMATNWWSHNNPPQPCCDSCSGPLSREDSFYRVIGRRMTCGSCADRALADWDLWPDYFGKGELQNALALVEKPVTREPAFTLYAYEAQGPQSTMGFRSVIMVQSGGVEDAIRAKTNHMEDDVVIVPPAQWNPPELLSLSLGELRTKFPEIIRQVKWHMASSGIKVPSDVELIQSGTVLPNEMSGRVFLVYRLPGAPQKSAPAPSPAVSFVLKAPSPAAVTGSARKWWQFWR